MDQHDPLGLLFCILRVKLKRLRRAEEWLAKRETQWQHEDAISATLAKSHEHEYIPKAFLSMVFAEKFAYLKVLQKKAEQDSILKRLLERKHLQVEKDMFGAITRTASFGIANLKNGILDYDFLTMQQRHAFVKQQIASINAEMV